METSILNQWFSDQQIRAVCWTLIHSLWIGFIIALLCGIVIGATRKSAAALRYRLLCSLLVLFVISMAITYYMEAQSNKMPAIPSPPPIVVMVGAKASVAQQAGTVLNSSLIDNTKRLFNQNANIIFLAWLLFFVLKSLKMISGLLHIRRIRTYKTQTVSEKLTDRLLYFAGQIGVRRVVSLVQSELVKVPVAVGWLKPMILLPVGIAFQLTPEQLDSILWHELAHIRRRDYLVNILQSIVETVFFFNPGLLWLSSLIRTEREACCDDMVLSRTNHKANYLEALLAFGYGEFKHTGFAMNLGSGNQLRDRLKRMISRENKRLGVIEKVVLITGVVILSAFAGLTKANKKYVRHLTNTAKKKTIQKDTVQSGLRQQAVPVPMKHLKLADTLKIGYFSVQSNRADDGTTIIYHAKADDNHGKNYRFVAADSKLMSMSINGKEIKQSDLPKYEYVVRAVLEKQQAMQKASIEYIQQQRNKPQSQDIQPSPQEPQQPQAPQAPPSLDKMIADVTNDLINEHILKDKSSLSTIKLTYAELIVNGVKQPDDMQKKFAAKYYPGNARVSKDPNYGLWYNARTHGVALGTFNIDLDSL